MEDYIAFEDAVDHNILIIEDQHEDATLIKDKIQEVLPFATIKIVRSLGQARQHQIEGPLDLLVMDLNLPDGYGPSSVTQIKKAFRDTPIIVITDMGSKATMVEAMKNGAAQIIWKKHLFHKDFKKLIQTHLPR